MQYHHICIQEHLPYSFCVLFQSLSQWSLGTHRGTLRGPQGDPAQVNTMHVAVYPHLCFYI